LIRNIELFLLILLSKVLKVLYCIKQPLMITLLYHFRYLLQSIAEEFLIA